MEKSMPVGKMARSTVAGVTAAKIGAKKLGLMSKRPFLSNETYQKHREKNQNEIAETLFLGLTRLRGSALKIAQIMSLELGILPDAYRKELYKSHYQVPPLNRAVIRRLLISEFGKPPEDIFKEFGANAFAAASLGQVHKAISHQGAELAVKVQYPGVDESLKTDVQLVRQFLLPFYSTEYVTRALNEIEARLCEEVDYDLERANTQWFAENAQFPNVVLPKVYAEYSSKHILTTELIAGSHIAQWLSTNPSQEQRDFAAQTIYDYFMYCVFKLHRMHSDPNPGNYLFREDGSIAVVDFGAVKAYTPEHCRTVLDLWQAHIRDDKQTVIELYAALGIAHGDKAKVSLAYEKTLEPFGRWLGFPYKFEVFDFGAHPDYCAQGMKLVGNMFSLAELSGFTTETIMFDRTFYGLFRIFNELKARVHLKNEWIG